MLRRIEHIEYDQINEMWLVICKSSHDKPREHSISMTNDSRIGTLLSLISEYLFDCHQNKKFEEVHILVPKESNIPCPFHGEKE